MVHMVLQIARPWKHPKTGLYRVRVRVRVPPDLVSIVERQLEKRSLGTKDAADARNRFALAMADLIGRWAHLRQKLVRPTFEQMNAWSADFFSMQANATETGEWSPF